MNTLSNVSFIQQYKIYINYNWFVINPINNDIFGPFISYKDACLKAESIDNIYGTYISRIEKAKGRNYCKQKLDLEEKIALIL